MADRCKEDSVVACTSVDEVGVVRRFGSNKGVLVVMQVVRVHLTVYSVSSFVYSRSSRWPVALSWRVFRGARVLREEERQLL